MKFQKISVFLLIFISTVTLFSCGGSSKKQDQSVETTPKKEIAVNAESQALLDYLVELGDYVNSREFPSLIKASSVYEELDANNLIIDLRDKESFAEGHIKGAVNVDFSNIPDYMTNSIKPFEYDRIIMVCYSGQISSYTTALLRLMGYGNVYAMRWGMSAWNKEFAENGGWLAKVSGEYEDQLETTEHEKLSLSDFPKMNTGKTTGEEILNERIKALFAAGYRDALVFANEVFENPSNYYVINYDRRDKYEYGHIPGAIRYKPSGTLGIKEEMETIPVDKDVVVYCNTGHNSGFATAYLRLFGYKAHTLTYGNNAFMYDRMIKDRDSLSWLPFTEAEIHDYPYVSN
ncbi:MAG: hypothetical protein JXR31_11785 [Prolixibacteraceae bacterium]|nr:hypothetical protein [Prolixibacteraceae bacterium]MBN2774925.1 hypothetical protein [Prolixibacteraceae bacterium]